MAFKDLALDILRGGLPRVLDGGPSSGTQGDVASGAPKGRVEQTPPEPTKKDTEPFLQRRIQVTKDFDINLAAGIVATLAIGFVILGLFRRA